MKKIITSATIYYLCNMKKPVRLTYSMMNDAVKAHTHNRLDNLYIDKDIGILNGETDVFKHFIREKTPFKIDDFRMGIIVEGEIHSIVNLQEYHLKAGTIICITPGTIVQPIAVSPDLRIRGLALFTDNILAKAGIRLPAIMNGQIYDLQLRPDTNVLYTINCLFDSIWNIVSRERELINDHVLGCLAGAIAYEYAHVFTQHSEMIRKTRDRNQEIFDHFMSLVNQTAGCERKLGYFAKQLFISERYLGAVVRQVSNLTAKEWLDRATIAEAKILLKHSDLQTTQIADKLQFPNSSFFCKYFKRLTGMTPNEYKRT
jgi:AraC-like DNA-binding protein